MTICQQVFIITSYKEMTEIGKRHGATWYSSGAVSKKGHPHHPLYLKKDSPLDLFDIENYLQHCV